MNLIIEVDNKKIVWFDNFFKSSNNKLGIHLSGGIDSSLLLWMICKLATDINNFDLTIYPCHARDLCEKNANTLLNVQKIIDVISKQFPKIHIQKINVGIFHSFTNCKKEKWAKSIENKLRNEYGVDLIIDARNMNLSEERAIQYGMDINSYSWTTQRDYKRDPEKILTGVDTFENVEEISPFFNIDKLGIKELYDRYGLMDTIFPLTFSCIEKIKPVPCKKCHWCIEKKAVFGVY